MAFAGMSFGWGIPPTKISGTKSAKGGGGGCRGRGTEMGAQPRQPAGMEAKSDGPFPDDEALSQA